jgi:peptidyl-prolyl cis-trans isomerase A (cyclophilin A)
MFWIVLLGLLLAPLSQAQPTAAPEILKDLPAGTYALFKTNHGEFVAKLHTDKAPIAAANFAGLAEGTKEYTDPRTGEKSKKPFYDGTIFHRIIAGFMIQGGDPTGTGRGGPGYTFDNEISPDLHHDKAGVLSMANTGRPNSNGCQFFITVAPQPRLDGGYTIFGEVVKGMSVVMEISNVPTQPSEMGENSKPAAEVRLEQVRIYRLGANGQLEGTAPTTSTLTAAKPTTATAEHHTTTTTKTKKSKKAAKKSE